MQAGRRVHLAVGRHSPPAAAIPRTRPDLVVDRFGLDRIPAQQRGPSRRGPVISGAYGGRTVDFRSFAAEGVTLLVLIEAADGGVINSSPTWPKASAMATRRCHLPRSRGRPVKMVRHLRCRGPAVRAVAR